MWFPAPASLKNSSEATRFVALRWRELFAKYTPDTYRPRLMDAPALLEELSWISEMAKADERWGRQLSVVKKELREVTADDLLLERNTPRLHTAFQNLSGASSPVECASIAKLGRQALEGYQDWAMDGLEELLDSNSKGGGLKQKAEADQLLGRIATRAVQAGFGRRYCEHLITEDHLELDASALLRVLRRGLNGTERDWLCIYALNDARNDGTIRQLLERTEFDLLENKRKPSGGEDWIRFKNATKGAHLACVAISSADPQNAVHEGLNRLNRLVHVVNFYYGASPISVEPKVFAQADRDQFFSELDATSISGIKPHRQATERALKLYERADWAQIPQEVVSSLQQRAAAYGATDVKDRFVNLWSALETLVSSRPEGSIHKRVLGCVPALVVATRPRKVVRYVAICLNRLDVLERLKKTTSLFQHSRASFIDPAEVLNVLCTYSIDHNGDRVNTVLKHHLFPATHTNALVCNRLFQLWKEFSDPALLLSSLDRSHRHVGWQIERIYRARNLLIHTGRRLDYLPYLLKNLEYYFAMVLGGVVHDVTNNTNWTVHDSLQSRLMDWTHLRTALERNPEAITASELLQMSWTDGPPDKRLWPNV